MYKVDGHATAVAVIGAGIMGHGIAQVFATGGYHVRLADASPADAERGKLAVEHSLTTAVEAGAVEADHVGAILDRIEPVEDAATAVTGASFVVEAVTENPGIKEHVWRTIGAAAPADAILATNTSSYDINWFTGLAPAPERVIGTHWFCPPPIVPCVEVIPADATDPAVTKRVIALLTVLGKEPAQCRSVPGFIGNRIQMAMVAEAFRCLEEGLAAPEDIDRIVRGSFGFRLGAYGPFEVGDLNGLDTYQAVFEYLQESYGSERFAPPAAVTEHCERGRYGVKAGRGIYSYTAEQAIQTRAERDRRLYAQLRSYQQAKQADDNSR